MASSSSEYMDEVGCRMNSRRNAFLPGMWNAAVHWEFILEASV